MSQALAGKACEQKLNINRTNDLRPTDRTNDRTDGNNKQGGLLAAWVEPMFLSSLVVSQDPRADGPGPLSSALRRAIPGRAALAMASHPLLSVHGGGGGGGGGDSAVVEISVAGVTFAKSKAQVGRTLGGRSLYSDNNIGVWF